MCARYLRGDFGDLATTSPYLVSVIYALDRASVAQEIEEWLAQGGWIVSNRYASASLAHQTARFATAREKSQYAKWANQLEYTELGVVPEDKVICLQIPPVVSQTLIAKKGARRYLKKMKQDIAEQSLAHQKQSADMFARLARTRKHWKLIRCTDAKGKLLPIETIHKKIVQSLHV